MSSSVSNPESRLPSHSDVRQAPTARLLVDPTGDVQALSGRAQSFVREELEVCIGRSVEAVFPAPMGPQVMNAIRHVVWAEEPMAFVSFHVDCRKWLDVRARSTEDGILLQLQDLTPRKQCEHLLELLDAAVLDGIWQVGPNGTITVCNNAYARFLGYDDAAALEGQAVADLYATTDTWARLRETALETGGVKNVVRRYRRRDGSVVRGRTRITVLRDDEGRMLGLGGTVTSVNAPRASVSEALMSRSVEAAANAVAITEPASPGTPAPRVLYVNSAFTDLTGYPASEVTDNSIRCLYGPSTREEGLERLQACLQDGQPFRGEMIAYRRNGMPYVSQWNVAPVRSENGEILQWVWVQHELPPPQQATGELDKDRLEALYWRMGPLLEATTPNEVATALTRLVRDTISDARVVVRTRTDDRLVVQATTPDASSVSPVSLAASHPAGRAMRSGKLVATAPYLHVPLGGHGVLSIDVSDVEHAPLRKLLHLISHHATTVWDRIAKAADQRAAHRRCDALRTAGAALLESPTVQDGAAAAFEAFAPLLPETVSYALLAFGSANDQAHVMATSDPAPAGLEQGTMADLGPGLRQMGSTDELHVFDAHEADTSLLSTDVLSWSDDRSYLAAPLRSDHEGRGVLFLSVDADEGFSPSQRTLIEEGAELLAAALPDALHPPVPTDTPAPNLRSAFLANLHHELRTPLTSIIGFAEVLGASGQEDQKHYASIIAQSGRRLKDTLSNLMTLAKLESGTIQVKPTPLSVDDHVQRVVDSLSVRAQKRGLSLTTDLPDSAVEAVVDQKGLDEIVTHLITNALLFTREGSVTVRVRPDGDAMLLSVTDTGIGMEPNRVSDLFNAFQQGSTGLRRSHDGCGLGLTIVQGWVDAMGGTIDVDTAPNDGTTVTVRLPRVGSPTNATH